MAKTLATTTDKTTDAVALLAQAEVKHAEAAALIEQAKRLAKGTGNVTVQARTAAGIAKAATMAERVEFALRGPDAPMTLTHLARVSESSADKLTTCLGKLETEGRVYNLGNHSHPCYVWKIGDETTHDELCTAVQRLIAWQPLLLSQLVEATGARRNRVSGVLVTLQKDPEIRKRLRDVGGGDGRAFRYYITPA